MEKDSRNFGTRLIPVDQISESDVSRWRVELIPILGRESSDGCQCTCMHQSPKNPLRFEPYLTQHPNSPEAEQLLHRFEQRTATAFATSFLECGNRAVEQLVLKEFERTFDVLFLGGRQFAIEFRQ